MLEITKALVSAAQSARSLRLSTSAAQILIGERERKLALIFCALNERNIHLRHKNLWLFFGIKYNFFLNPGDIAHK